MRPRRLRPMIVGVPPRVGAAYAGIGRRNCGSAIARERLVQGLDAEARLERVGQAPGQHLAARPVHHGDQVQKAEQAVGPTTCGHLPKFVARRVRSRLPPPPPRPVGARTPGLLRAHRRFLVVFWALSAVTGKAPGKREAAEARSRAVSRRSSRKPGFVVRGGRSRDTRPRTADLGSGDRMSLPACRRRSQSVSAAMCCNHSSPMRLVGAASGFPSLQRCWPMETRPRFRSLWTGRSRRRTCPGTRPTSENLAFRSITRDRFRHRAPSSREPRDTQ